MFWIEENCNLSRVDYVMKADVDTLVNIYYILATAWYSLHTQRPYDYICWYLSPQKEVDRRGRCAEPMETYSNVYWPRYCHGPAYTSHVGVFRTSLQNIPKMLIVKNEDVMMTALSLNNVTDLKVFNLPGNRLIRQLSDWHYYRGNRHIIRPPHEMVLAHELPGELWHSVFEQMHQPRLLGKVKPTNTVIRNKRQMEPSDNPI